MARALPDLRDAMKNAVLALGVDNIGIARFGGRLMDANACCKWTNGQS